MRMANFGPLLSNRTLRPNSDAQRLSSVQLEPMQQRLIDKPRPRLDRLKIRVPHLIEAVAEGRLAVVLLAAITLALLVGILLI